MIHESTNVTGHNLEALNLLVFSVYSSIVMSCCAIIRILGLFSFLAFFFLLHTFMQNLRNCFLLLDLEDSHEYLIGVAHRQTKLCKGHLILAEGKHIFSFKQYESTPFFL